MVDKITKSVEIDILERRVHRLTVDSVTKLLKKEGVIDRVLENDENISEVLSGSVAIISIDLDNFKEINDNFGHKNGDIYLGDICSEIDRLAWGERDDIGFAFRGKEGDEVAVVLKVNDTSMEEYTKRVLDFTSNLNDSLVRLGKIFSTKGINRINPSLSLGSVFEPSGFSTSYPQEKLSLLLDLIDTKADMAVYESKSRKTNRAAGKLADLSFYEKLNV